MEHQGGATQSLIRKLTTEKAVKAHRQQSLGKEDASEDDISNIKLASRGIKTIESLDLPSLRRLDLSKNSLNRLKGLQGCPQVTYLTAAGNVLTGDGLDGIRALKDLKVLNASGNRVRRIPPAVFSQFRQLQALVVNNNEIAEVPPTWFKKGLLSLNTLVLSHNKIKSLSDSGLGRLTALTKISVSHNTLVELPDLSACTGLEELRAAHNLISQVPASLSKNATLRTLDLGHNRIDKWVGLERLGKSLKSLMQLSLAGNPLCRSPATTASEVNEEGGQGEVEEGEYVGKVRSLFPGLKVRDGKRILMKKSHTYYETRGGEEGGSAAQGVSGPGGRGPAGRPAAVGGRAGLDARPDGAGRRKVEQRDKKKGMKSPKSKEVRVDGGAQTIEEEEGGDDRARKAAGKMKKAARAASATLAAAEEGKVEAAALEKLGKPHKKSEKKRRREEEERTERYSRSPFGTAATAAVTSDDIGKSKKKQQRRPSETAAVDSVVENAAVTDDGATATSEHKASKTKKKKKTKHDRKGTSGIGGSVGRPHQDPYSSSEELPIPISGRQPPKSATAAAVPVDGDRESGVVSVVMNKKRKGTAVGGAAKPWQGGAAPGTAEDGGRFSFDAILEARGEKETIGLGSGVSAWDT
eukprot:g12597.t1